MKLSLKLKAIGRWQLAVGKNKKPIVNCQSSIIILSAFLFLIPVAVHAQQTTSQTCRNRIVNELSQTHDEFRSHIFGSRKDRDGKFKVLTGGEVSEERLGILETKGRLTSELVAPIVESYRVLRCQDVAICETMAQSIGMKGGLLDVRPLGCAQVTVSRYDECYLAGDDTSDAGMNDDAVTLAGYCNQMIEDSLRLERRVLQLAVAYDSGYRATMQFAGMIDCLTRELPRYVMEPVRDMINLLGRLHQIPCFIGQCDFPDNSGLSSTSKSSSSSSVDISI